MSSHNKLSRRDWLKGALSVSGAALGTRLSGRELIGIAEAQAAKKSAVISLFLEGGFNAVFSSTDSFVDKRSFGVGTLSAKPLGNGLFVDAPTIGTLGSWALSHVAAIGNRHGAIDHISAQRQNFLGDNKSYVVQLAAAMGGNAAFKAVSLGNLPTPGVTPSSDGVSIQLLRTMGDVSTALGLGPIDYNRPARGIAGRALDKSRVMSEAAIAKNRRTMTPLSEGYATLVDSLTRPVPIIDVAKVSEAYGVSAGGGLDTVASKLAAAELMVRSGTNVVTLSDTGWDTHGDPDASTARRKMTSDIIPSLGKFLSRLQSEPELAAMNISLILHGDFARDLPTSDHAPALSALVFGPNVKVGTTGKVSAAVKLPDNTGASKQMWSYMAALARVQKNPFGENPHQLVL